MNPADLELDYLAWRRFLATADLDESERRWLAAWDSLDLAWSPMPDERRRLLRLGHYLGWQARRRLP